VIGPWGLRVVVLHQFAVPSSVLWVRLEKGLGLKEYNLHVRNIFVGSHTEHHWRCSKENQNVSGQQQRCVKVARDISCPGKWAIRGKRKCLQWRHVTAMVHVLNHAMKHAKHEPCRAQNNKAAKFDGGSLMWPGEQSLKQCDPLLFPVYYFHPDFWFHPQFWQNWDPITPKLGPVLPKALMS